MNNDKKSQMEAAWAARESKVEKEKEIAWNQIKKNVKSN
jgi:hypothetical protein